MNRKAGECERRGPPARGTRLSGARRFFELYRQRHTTRERGSQSLRESVMRMTDLAGLPKGDRLSRLRTPQSERTSFHAPFLHPERASQPTPSFAPSATPSRGRTPKEPTPHMAQASDTLKTKSAPPAAAAAPAPPAGRTLSPRVLRARARLRALHRRRFKESARNK